MSIFHFGAGAMSRDPRANDKDVVGGKGANLAEMARIGLPVPPGFTIGTDICRLYLKSGNAILDDLRSDVLVGIEHIELTTHKRFGDPVNPLLVSIRSGARSSMPGMMDTILNLGLNDNTVEGLAGISGCERFAWDCYRRFIQMYSEVVFGVERDRFETAIEEVKAGKGVDSDGDLGAEDWRSITRLFKKTVEDDIGQSFPQDVHEQLWWAIQAVFDSWESERARVYRRLNNIPGGWGTAVNVQAMVFGNMGMTSATGVAFTRDPSTGERIFYGEWLPNAQGEDVVAGIRTPQYLTAQARKTSRAVDLSLEESQPEIFCQLSSMFDLLESHYRDMQDIEFTIESGRLWLLQTRSGKRTAKASLRIAVEMVHEGLIDEVTAVQRVDPSSLEQLLHPTLDPKAPRDIIGRGLPASPGAVSGAIVLDADAAERRAALGEKVILFRTETSPDDIHGMHAAKGIVTARGGMTSHAAVVARGMGRPCVSGVSELSIDLVARTIAVGDRSFSEQDIVTIDGTRGEVMAGAVPMISSELAGEFATLMGWADRHRRMKVRANADTPEDCRRAHSFGAEGIGLCRTEHMFFDPQRIANFREMILADDREARDEALDRLLPAQREDFTAIFTAMAGLPVTIRLLDPPLHEFLPREAAEMEDLAERMGTTTEKLRRRCEALHEMNPMLGHRGCRLGLSYPEIYRMQACAIFEAACEIAEGGGEPPILEVMVPLVGERLELARLRELVEDVATTVFEERGTSVDYVIGTMIEVPRAALMADDIAQEAGFFSFGTNDLTQMTLGVSRDDAAKFLGDYVEQGIYPRDPFISLDVAGVGQLVRLAAERGRLGRPDLKLGICGEHGGDAASIAFCEEVGLDYVSCSTYRLPIARLAAAQARLRT